MMLITLFFCMHLPSLHFRNSIYDLVIEDLPETSEYQAFKQEFGNQEMILVVIKSENIFDPQTFRKIDGLAKAFLKIEGVRRVISLPGIKREMDVTDKWSLPDFERIIAPAALFQRNLISNDKKTTVISCLLEDRGTKDPTISALKKIIAREKNGLSIYQIGMPIVSKALAAYTKNDFLWLPPIAFLVMALVLFVLFRNLRGIMIPVVCVLSSLIWTFGIMAWTGTPLAMLTMIVPIFIIAVGTAYCLHIAVEYRYSMEKAHTAPEAAFECLSKMGFPTFLAVLTTLIGLGSLLVNRIGAVREFAVFGCAGMLSLLFIMLFFLPALLSILPLATKSAVRSSPQKDLFDRFLAGIVQINLRHQRMTLSIISMLVLIGILGAANIKVETNPLEFFKKNTPVSRHFHDIYKDMSGSFPINVVLDSKKPDYFDDPSHIQKLAELQAFLDSLDGVDKTLSFADYLKLANYATHQYDRDYYALPEKGFEVRSLMNKIKTMLGQDLFNQFMDADISKANILLRSHLSSSRDFLLAKQRISRFIQENYPQDFGFQITGFGMVISQSSQLLTQGQVKSLSLTLVIVFGIMALLFLSVGVGVIAILANCFPLVVNFGLMGWLGIELSVATSLIACIAIGLVVDDTIHYLVRYNREFKKDADKNRALRDTLMSVGRPILFTTLTISLGFSILIFSHFKPTAVFGILLVATMASALVGDLVVLPSLMLRVKLVTVWDFVKSMSPIDKISAEIAHELNQPLNAIKMGSEFLKMMITGDSKVNEEQLSQVANEISLQVDRASGIINRLREFDRGIDSIRQQVDVNLPLREVLAHFSHHFNLLSIDVKLNLDDALPPVTAHHDGLRQIFFNLLANAGDALSQKNEENQGARLISVRSYTENKKVVVTVSDTGSGIPAYAMKWIFEPFFTVKGKKTGKGLGLFITRGMIKRYHGDIQVESEKGKGTTFKVTFPSASK
ncbi:MMPL family transporter [Thermodesulfobacteriota bacterium]